MATTPDPNEAKPGPSCKAMLLCERVVLDAGTRQVSLIGLINKQVLTALPGRTLPMKVFLHLVDGIGEYQMFVHVLDLAEDRVIAKAKRRPINFPDRPYAIQYYFGLPPLPIKHAGRYDVIVLGNGSEIERQQIRIEYVEVQGDMP